MTVSVYRAVCAAFHGEPPFVGAVARHLDGDPKNNTPGNLAWGTPGENSGDMLRHGTRPRGEGHGMSRLTERDVREIRHRRAEGWALARIADQWGITRQHAWAVASGRKWGWLND